MGLKSFYCDLDKLQPSQLYINEDKLLNIQRTLNTAGESVLEPIPIKQLDADIIFTDGHTRALILHKLGYQRVLVEWEDEDLSWVEYQECVKWCKDEGIHTIGDLEGRIISNEDY